MNVPQFTRLIGLLIAATTGYYLWINFEYMVSIIENRDFINLGAFAMFGWYIFSIVTVISLFRLDNSGCLLGNAWLIYSAFSSISSYLSFRFIYTDAEIVGNELSEAMFLIFYAIVWYFFNGAPFRKHFKVEGNARIQSVVIPIGIVIGLFFYNWLRW